MSDSSVAAALRSTAKLVVVEAPAGCGKTFQGGNYARDVSETIGGGRVLIVTHTHAACDVFASRTRGARGHVEIRTIDSLIVEIATAYHVCLKLPPDPSAWARTEDDGYKKLAAKVAGLVRASPNVAQALVCRYPIIICDEHQDATADQEAVITACHRVGAAVRVFGDPMQRIFGQRKQSDIDRDVERWQELKNKADKSDVLDHPHRWSNGSSDLGQWILAARSALQNGGQVDLRGPLPSGIQVIFAENISPTRTGYRLDDGKPIYDLVRMKDSLLVLAAQNETVWALRGFFGRQLPIWEGHVRENLSALITALQKHKADAPKIAEALVEFLQNVATGFSASAYANCFLAEVSAGCIAQRRGKPATLQGLARIIIDSPDHRGVALVLRRLSDLRKTDEAFKDIKVHYLHEFWEAVRLGKFDDADQGFDEICRRRTYARPTPPAKAISTIHKAKGLERDDVLLMPCDGSHYGNTFAARCRLYVAMSRAMRSLTFVVSRGNPSPLILLRERPTGSLHSDRAPLSD